MTWMVTVVTIQPIGILIPARRPTGVPGDAITFRTVIGNCGCPFTLTALRVMMTARI